MDRREIGKIKYAKPRKERARLARNFLKNDKNEFYQSTKKKLVLSVHQFHLWMRYTFLLVFSTSNL